jgi:hypothetical protein
MRLIFGVAFDVLVFLFKSESPILWGMGGGLVGALLGAGAGLLSEMALHALYPVELWPAMAILVGYPIGACCGITLANQERLLEGSFWPALLGAFSGAALGMALWKLTDGTVSLRTPEWLPVLALVVPVFLIPALATWARDFKPPSEWGRSDPAWRSRHFSRQAASHPEPPPKQQDDDSAKVTQVVGGAKRRHVAKVSKAEGSIDVDIAAQPRTCGACAMENPPSSIFCGECGALLWASRN